MYLRHFTSLSRVEAAKVSSIALVSPFSLSRAGHNRNFGNAVFDRGSGGTNCGDEQREKSLRDPIISHSSGSPGRRVTQATTSCSSTSIVLRYSRPFSPTTIPFDRKLRKFAPEEFAPEF